MSGSKQDTTSACQWQPWVAEHGPKFLLFARQQARCEADAQDLVQESVVECWQRCSLAAPPPLPLVFATIRRRAIDLARQTDRRAQREWAAASPEPATWFDTGLEDRERAQTIQAAMMKLSEAHREAVALKLWGGLTFAEISEILGIPANTVASRYRYALAELRKRAKEVLA